MLVAIGYSVLLDFRPRPMFRRIPRVVDITGVWERSGCYPCSIEMSLAQGSRQSISFTNHSLSIEIPQTINHPTRKILDHKASRTIEKFPAVFEHRCIIEVMALVERSWLVRSR